MKIYLALAVPLLDSQKPVGAVLLRIDPYQFLYPFIQAWPMPSRTSETLLVQREGNEVVFLNELRHRKNSALSLRLKLTQAQLPAALAVFGERKVFVGRDYRGVTVLAAVRPVPGSPWSIVAKEDLTEIYAPIQEWARRVFGAVGLAIVAVGVFLGFWWRQQVRHFYRTQYEQELERRVLERTGELKAVNKELEAFSYSISHDLRSPLRAMSGFSQIVFEEYSERLDEKGKDLLTRVVKASQQMANLIDGLQALFRYTRIEMHWNAVDLSRLAATIGEAYRQRQPARTVEFIVQPGIVVQGDERLLQVVLENLLDNAWKFTAVRDPARIEFGRTQIEGRAVYFVRDNGVGFDMRYVDTLFKTFTRLHRVEEYPGMGIGLAASQRILRRHGGKIWAQAEEGKGGDVLFYAWPAPVIYFKPVRLRFKGSGLIIEASRRGWSGDEAGSRGCRDRPGPRCRRRCGLPRGRGKARRRSRRSRRR